MCDSATFSLLSDRNLVPPSGTLGGWSGAPNSYRILRNGEPLKLEGFPGKVSNLRLLKGDIVEMMSAGGGGYGNPHLRPLSDVLRDLEDEIITPEGAKCYSATLENGELVR